MLNFSILKEASLEARLTLLLARWIVYNYDSLEIEDLLMQESIAWKRLHGFITYHELSSLAYPYLRRYSYLLPHKETELLEKSYYYCLAHLFYLWKEFKCIVNACKDKNIEFVPLKGIAFIVDNIYADKTYLRPMCDIDLLIKERELPLAATILESLGYEKDLRGMQEDYWKEENYHLGFIRKSTNGLFCHAELHWALDYKRDKPILPNLWNRIKKSKVEDKDVYLLSPEDTLFCLALHQRRFGKMLSLKNACDVAMVLDRYNTELDWDYILKEAKVGDMRTTLYFVLTQANLLLDIQIPIFVIRSLDVPKYKKRLIEQFILKDTFSLELNNGRVNINNLYLKSHFLLYDNLWEPVRSVLNVPQEQFAKFYKLPAYTIKTNLLYRFRYLYILKNFFTIMLETITKMLHSAN